MCGRGKFLELLFRFEPRLLARQTKCFAMESVIRPTIAAGHSLRQITRRTHDTKFGAAAQLDQGQSGPKTTGTAVIFRAERHHGPAASPGLGCERGTPSCWSPLFPRG